VVQQQAKGYNLNSLFPEYMPAKGLPVEQQQEQQQQPPLPLPLPPALSSPPLPPPPHLRKRPAVLVSDP
jgi:hypothetical protein